MNSILKSSDPLIQIETLQMGTFNRRPNRYLSEVVIHGALELVHVHDPGRLKELLFEDNTCLVKPVVSETRKTKWDMVFARKGEEWILVHSAYHRYLAEALLKRGAEPFGPLKTLKAEVKAGKSRLDFKVQNEADVLELLKEVHYSIMTYEDSRFAMKTQKEILEMIKRGSYRSSEDFSNSEDKVPYEIDFTNARRIIQDYRRDLTWEEIVRAVSSERK